MMDTKTTGAGRFSQFDLAAVPSPCFVVDKQKILENLQILSAVQEASGANILLALKAFSFWSLGQLISDHLHGCCASGLWEAQLARKHYRGLLSTYSPAYKADEMEQICMLSDHVIVNSLQQLERVSPVAALHSTEVGLRINPQLVLGEVEKYDPSAAGSRLGVPLVQMEQLIEQGSLGRIDGLHMHSLCEQGLSPLQQLVQQIEPVLEKMAPQLSWLNLGGGHMITHPDYDRDGLVALLSALRERYALDVYLEPGTAIAFDSGILVGEILDVIDNDGPVAITDISATCHMPDVLEAPYRPALLGETQNGMDVELGGPSCLAGDRIGNYHFKDVPSAGDRIAFLDQAHYSMVKTTTFNGVRLPSIAVWDSEKDKVELLRKFDFEDFENRLS